MSQANPPRRRWFQFGIGTMLLLVTLVAVSLLAATEHWDRRRLQAVNTARLEMLRQADAESKRQIAHIRELHNELSRFRRAARDEAGK